MNPAPAVKPAAFGGFRVLLSGGAVIAALLVWLSPRVATPCPNAGAAGNASLFADPPGTAGWS